ncbi:MAG: selenide, water dikinase SelD [Pelagimonas sp.]|uniref:selenide, water dikinase SelD n=1 Tax=Pelagimonas sp. TaxID=2073170 RepID=UPI003D6A5255
MNSKPLSLSRDLVLVGGGHTHALVLREWGMKRLPGARVTLINSCPTAPYSGMLPGFLAGHYERRDLDIDLVKLARFAGARIVIGSVQNIDLDNRTVSIQGRPDISFDIASINVGITTKMPNLKGFSEFGVPAKPLDVFSRKWERFLKQKGPARVAIIGGGVAGSEIALAFAHALRSRSRDYCISILDSGTALSAIRAGTRKRILSALQGNKIDLLEKVEISEVTADGLRMVSGDFLSADFVCGAAGANPQNWLTQTGLELHDGFIKVSEHLQSSDPSVFAAGDCAHMTNSPRPKAGVFAVRQANVLFPNLRARLTETSPMRSYSPQKDYLKLVSLGGKTAIGDRFGFSFQGTYVWRLKNRIDRSFMAKFKSAHPALPKHVPKAIASGSTQNGDDKPLCGGCGSKVSQSALQTTLSRLPLSNRQDIIPLPGDDAALLLTGGVKQVISTDHLRAFVEDPVTMTKVAANHALGDIWSMGATPQAATANIILPQMTTDLAQRSLREIMVSANQCFTKAGAAIVGGHTSFGCELTIGFTVTGICETPPITLSGAGPNQFIILTKPIGTGVIMAAEMIGAAKGEWVAAAIEAMCQSQASAARILKGASAMTDVTGFGLAGHMMNICQASNVGAVLQVNEIRTLPGSLELAQTEIHSTLFEENRKILPELSQSPLHDLLFDPQTAGGLLAVVKSAPEQTLNDLRDAGYDASLIGTTTDRVGHISIT